MNQRDALLVFVAVLLAVAIAAIFYVGAITTAAQPPGEIRPRFFIGDRPPRPERTFEQVQGRVPGGFRGVVFVQREVAAGAREAAGFLLMLIGVSGALLLGREQVLATYRASRGGWRAQLRTLGIGGAILALAFSASFLSFVVLFGMLAGAPRPPIPFAPIAQVGLTAMSVVVVAALLVAVVGFTAASLRLGESVLALRPIAALGARVPTPLAALLGATIVFVFAQVPVIRPAILLLTFSYALGAVAIARMAPQTAPATS